MQFPLTFLLHLGLLSFTKAQDKCHRSACHPTTGDLLVGRSAQLTASSTCGLDGAQKYCILSYLEGEQKCFICDSRFPYDPYTQSQSHTIENVITSFEPGRDKKWWQAENGLDHVSIRLDLEVLFQFSHLILTFKTFRPAAMLVERSTDYGHTWKVLRYFAKDCAASFPNITSGQAQGVGDLVCDSKYSDIEPSSGGEVVLKVLDPRFEIENPYSPYIQDLVTLTNLRINFTKLHTLGDTLLARREDRSLDNYYYALSNMVVGGSCFCHGHASECSPVQKVRGDVFSPPGMVHGQCVCQHHTDGPNCERCKGFFQDVPWRPAAGLQDSACRACRCNGHSDRCHFDMTAYLASGGRSGGVCEDCQHHTEGQHCDRCRPLFYRDPLRAMSDPYACIPCECDPDGTLSGGICVSHSDPALGSVAGQCLCKENVEGAKCDQCKPNHHGLSAADPLGCQPCNCNPLGSLPLSACDVETGQCACQSFATGPHCEECTVGYWGLENHLHGCSPCDCDIGGAYSNVCSPKDGQCECRPHITGRSCTESAPGYFFAPLNFYLYEAEEATPLQGLAPLIAATALPTCDVYFQQQGSDFIVDKGTIILKRNQKQSVRADEQSEGSVTFGQVPAVHGVFREPVPGSPTAWTGPGFARVLPGAGLRFAVDHIALPMDFTIAIRYEIQPAADWAVKILVNPLGKSKHCPRETPWPRPQSFPLPATSRIVLLPTPICLEPDVQYSIDVYFSQPLEGGAHAHSHILVDSLSLIPQINSLENFCSKQDLDEYHLHNCVEIALKTGPQMLPGACERLIVSMSARLNNGAVACKCHPQGSVGPNCSRLGGQCQCKPHVAGRCCDRCSTGSYGLGHHGCHPCHCHPQGSKSAVCDQITGQCACQGEVAGLRCDRCLAGYFGFPNCRPCLCNGFAELCDPETGSCFNCGGFTTGRNCERCIDGYYGDPPSGHSCRPCPCPDVPSSNQYFAHSCYQDPWSSDVICNCLQGYAGKQCGECSAGFYGNPRISGAPCRPCTCNNNIDVTDPESCSRVTGECLRCLHDTQGPNCQFCKPGHFGSAINQTCRRCSCHPSGVTPAACPPGQGACLCDPNTGTCPCLPNVTGQTCDRCADGYWNLVPGRGCQPCNCDPRTSHSGHCDQLTGQCPCKLGYDGKHCSECKENYYGDPLGRCLPCDCNTEGTQKPVCDQNTGRCRCREGVSGPRCDRCARGRGQEFPACPPCHRCFDQWDRAAASLSKAVQGLIGLAANTEDKTETLLVCEADFKGLRENMSEIERILKHPVFSSGEFLKAKDYQDSVREQITQLSLQLKAVHEFQDLKETMVRMKNEADLLLEDLWKEIDLRSRAHTANIMDPSETIKKHYQRSSSAEKKVTETTSIIKNSEKTRNDLHSMFDTLSSKENLSLEKLKQITVPDIQILVEKVCGVPGDMPCVLPSCGDPSCRGSRTLSGHALQQAQEAESVIHNLSDQVQGWKNQLKNVSKLAEVSKSNALQLSEKLRNMKNQSESEEEKMSLLIKQLKKFLSEENVPPEDIEKVANRVLDIHLPIASQNLTRELDKIRKLMQLCEDNRTDAGRLNKAADEARKVLVKAKGAEKAANVLLNLDKTLNRLQRVQTTQGRINSAITQLTAEITKIKKNTVQAEKEAKDTENKLDSAKQQSVLEAGLSQLRTTLQRNRGRAARVRAQAASAQRQAGGLEEEFAELSNQYAVLQHKTSATGLTKVTLDKVEQLKEAAEKLATDTEDKIRRIADLEKKIQDLNLSRQEKADQLKELEDQVVAIKNEIVERENKYAACYS
ncbi:laminin subunit beta-4 [Herpailurus yagouaroundi]|uniref:laminin subunit beta-4 n=1 Tax=Herpailurus yagouaroundi TaxID=1608482 RepID=UPI001AD7502A|nr:laminin subunit beta-4 [Puma yagouaroundi]XP_040328881.1 laminin subunit beta-4 [Puma yagouaroundi]XP_040328883.1 laminin subunit beta-4 [Puma yagouaroundi]